MSSAAVEMSAAEKRAADDARFEAGAYDGVLEVIDHTGDTKYMWDAGNEVEVAVAKAAFDEAKKRGAMVYKAKGKDGTQGKQLREFDATAERMIVVPQLVGG